jgi:DNA modification methylase
MEYEIIIGDSRVELQKIISNKYKAVITSPPYNIGKPYKGYSDKKLELEYQLMLRDVFRECKRVLREDGLMFINIADEAKNWYRSHDILRILNNSLKMIPIHRIIWKKPNVQALAIEKQIGFAHEFIFVLAKSNEYKLKYYEPNDVWEFYSRKEDWLDHPAVFPPELPYRCARLICDEGDWLLDPFGGVGNTMLAARHMKLNCTIIELSNEYLSQIKMNVKYGQSMFGGEIFRIYQNGELKDEVKCEEKAGMDKEEEEREKEREREERRSIGLLKYIGGDGDDGDGDGDGE